METLLLWLGRLAAIAGLAMVAWAACSRLTGIYFAAGYQVGTLLLVGIAAMLVGCVCFLVVLTDRSRR